LYFIEDKKIKIALDVANNKDSFGSSATSIGVYL